VAPELPDRIGRYTVVSSLGRGTFAEAFRVRADDGTQYALKRNLVDDATSRERLRNEIRVLRLLEHRGVPRFVEAGGPDMPFVFMGLASGNTVASSIEAKAEAGSVHGDIETLQILVGLLDVLVHLADRNVVHRDIKAANVLSTQSASRVSLIDFGFAKAHGTTQIRMGDSFFRAGAVRYSPPTKIENPGTADASHDVFAAGVLAYLMLAGDYPWSIEPTGDLGVYRRHISSHVPEVIHERNPFVRREIGEFVMSLIRTADRHRPPAEAAHAQALVLLKGNRAGMASRRPGRVSYPHVSRDPLHGDIRLTQLEWEVVQTREMQRLRHIKQLGLTHYAYLGAEHSRLSHAVGCLHRVEQILSTIEAIEGVSVDLETRLVARLYALVHDVTHVAFGHTVEDELGIYESHDDNLPRRTRLLLDSRSRLNRRLREDDIGRAVLEHYDPEATVLTHTGVPELTTGTTGADVLDYIDRDAYHCGLDHRVDSAIFRQFRWYRSEDREEPRLISLLYGSEGLRVDREYAVESLLLERYAMFLKIYTHKTKTAASALLGKALTAALVTGGRRADVTEQQYEWLADAELLALLISSRKQLPAELAKELRRGELPRGVYRAQLLGPDDRTRDAYDARRQQLVEDGYLTPTERSELESELARSAGLDAGCVIIYCPTRAPGFQRVRHSVAETGRRPHALDPTGQAFRHIERKHLALWELWVFSRAASRDQDADLAAAIEEKIGLPNLMAHDRRAGRLW
jgi:uncharacterized protein